MKQVSQQTSDMWNGYVNQGAQQFMNEFRRGNPAITVEQACAEYVQDIPFMFGEYHEVRDEETGETELTPWSADELDNIRGYLVAYLEMTEGEEWE